MSECQPWTGARNAKGYGIATVRDSTGSRMAHRVAYESAHGPIPTGLRVLHSCDNPPCTNPTHLRVGTPAENTADMMRRGRGVAPRSLRNGKAKLSDGQVFDMRTARAGGETLASLADRYGIHSSYASRLVRGVRRQQIELETETA